MVKFVHDGANLDATVSVNPQFSFAAPEASHLPPFDDGLLRLWSMRNRLLPKARPWWSDVWRLSG